MENKDNDMTIEEFAELYNRVMDWNKDILDSIGSDFMYSGNDYVRDIIITWLPTEKITPETCDYSSYEIFDTESNEKELQVYNYTRCHGTYYWVCLDETEKEYKRRKIKNMTEAIQNSLGKIADKMEGLTIDKYNLMALLEQVRVIKHKNEDTTLPEQEEQGNRRETNKNI